MQASQSRCSAKHFLRAVCTAIAFSAATAITVSGQAFTNLYSFHTYEGNGPVGGLVQGTDGNFYGTTSVGGGPSCNGGCGTVFKITPGGTMSTLHVFDLFDGAYPFATMVQATDGNFYGTTSAGGFFINCSNGCGTVFKITPSGTLSTIYKFNLTDGSMPAAGLVQGSDGNFYGTTPSGGATGGGTVFKLTPAGTLTTLYNFCSQPSCADGSTPHAGLVQATDGNFYGAAEWGGAYGNGTIFKITPNGAATTIYSFCSAGWPCYDGSQPYTGLLQATDGNFYGTTVNGNFDLGTVFKITPGGALTTIYSFCPSTDRPCPEGLEPNGPLVQDTDGNFYGTTVYGGGYDYSSCSYNGCGTVFKLNADGILSTLHRFEYVDGGWPQAGLVRATDGNFYGVTTSGGDLSCFPNYGCGTIFRVSDEQVNPTTTTVTSTPNPSSYLQPVTITATVSPAGATGAVAFTSNGTTIPGCAEIVLAAGQAVCTTISPLDAGTDTLVATYSGDTYYLPSRGMTSQSVDSHLLTTTEVWSSPNHSIFGDPVNLTATVGSPLGGEPTGTVDISSNGVPIPGCVGLPLGANYVTCLTSTLAVGTDTLVATYSGDSNYAPSSGMNSQIVNPVPTPVQFFPVTPCRVVDTRNANGPFGGPPITGNTSRAFPLSESDNPCSIPASAVAYSLNVTVVPMGRLGYLTIWPASEGQPLVSTLNSLDGRVKANAAIVPAGMPSGSVSVYVTQTSNVVLDIDGYFAPAGQGSLQFYTLAPCRVVDTRPSGSNLPPGLGPPTFGNRETRPLPVSSSACFQGLPNQPLAYSFNVTVVPQNGQALNYLTIWPSDQTQPFVSTLNDPTATVVANAALVPAAANGNVSVFTTNTTDVIIDTNGYFAAPGANGYSFYAVTPCRVLDTRNNFGQPFQHELTVNVVGSPCAPLSLAKAYVFNATVVPPGFLDYLTLWPDGLMQPLASTLNAYDGLVTSNMAIIPTTNGSIDAYASQLTHLILDISGYFAP